MQLYNMLPIGVNGEDTYRGKLRRASVFQTGFSILMKMRVWNQIQCKKAYKQVLFSDTD